MKRFWKYLLWTLVILLLVIAVVLYIVPYYLKQRESRAGGFGAALHSVHPVTVFEKRHRCLVAAGIQHEK